LVKLAPRAFLPTTTTRMRWPASALVSVYLRPVAGRDARPARAMRITLQRATPEELHRCHRKLSPWTPLQRPGDARRVFPTMARPVIFGRLWFTGSRLREAGTAAAAEDAQSIPQSAATAMWQTNRLPGRVSVTLPTQCSRSHRTAARVQHRSRKPETAHSHEILPIRRSLKPHLSYIGQFRPELHPQTHCSMKQPTPGLGTHPKRLLDIRAAFLAVSWRVRGT
jgi:hypothetical protein